MEIVFIENQVIYILYLGEIDIKIIYVKYIDRKMPKHDVDYSKNVIYKINCKDTNVTDLYVGRTTDFIRRKYTHMRSCKSKINMHVHKCILTNGGWDNWTMTIIEEYPCNNTADASDRESYWINTLEASLNVNFPLVNTVLYKKEWYFKNKQRVRELQNEYRENKKNELAKTEKMYKIDTENIDNNEEWYLNNVKNQELNKVL